MLEFLDRAGIEEVKFPVSAPLVLTAIGDLHTLNGDGKGGCVHAQHVAGNVFERHTAQAGREIGKVAIQDIV